MNALTMDCYETSFLVILSRYQSAQTQFMNACTINHLIEAHAHTHWLL